MASRALIRLGRTLSWRGSEYLSRDCFDTRSMSTMWPRLESAAGRARKRRRRTEKNQNKNSITGPQRSLPEEVVMPPYPQGQPWRVLWPIPHEESPKTVGDKTRTRYLPKWSELKDGWKKYMETWEDGLRGEPSPEKVRERQAEQSLKETGQVRSAEVEDVLDVQKIQSNVIRNLKDAKEMLEQARDSKDDLQKMAGDSMKLATECLKEFMAGYRQGRDQEIDKMLNEYFQDKAPGESVDDTSLSSNRQSRRKKKRVSLR